MVSNAKKKKTSKKKYNGIMVSNVKKKQFETLFRYY